MTDRSTRFFEGAAAFASNGVSLVAGMAVFVSVTARAIMPCLRGLAIGLDKWINRAAFVQDVLSLGLLLAAFTLVGVQITTTASSRTPLFLRALAMLAAGAILMMAVAAPAIAVLPKGLLVALSSAAVTITLLSGAASMREPSLRAPSIAAIGVTIGTLARTAALYVSARVHTLKHEGATPTGVLATVAYGADVLVLLAVAFWVGRTHRKVSLPMVLGAIALAALGTVWAVRSPNDTGVFAVLIRLGARELLVQPIPLVPYWAEVFVVLLGLVLAVAALVAPKQARPICGALAIFALVRSTAEVPIHAMLVAAGSLGLLLAQYSPRAAWAAVPDVRPIPARSSTQEPSAVRPSAQEPSAEA